MGWACPTPTFAYLLPSEKEKEGAADAAPSETSGSDVLVALGESVVGHVRLTQTAQEVGLEARTFADDGMDGLEVHQLLVADEACVLAKCPVEGEADRLDAARGSPGVGDLVAAFVLGGGGEDHMGHAGVGFIEGLPEQFVVVPVGAAREDDHRAGGRVVFATLGSDEGGDNWAVIATLIEDCKLGGINPHSWLTQTLEKLPNGHPANSVGELMPWNAVA